MLNKIKLCNELEHFLSKGNLPLGKDDDTSEIASAELLEERVSQALAVICDVRDLW